jgi:xylulose-5-phosphate/fructose-6-phosphate phosphoketolase
MSAELTSVARYRRATNYLAAAQTYLKDNVLLDEPLRPTHIKDRLLGHWGTCPGINLVYAHLNRLIRERDANILLITGPGHGAAANLANLYLEGTLSEFYPELTRNRNGLERFVRAFSWPGGFPSHLSPPVPGTIHEGGELGYALATAYGAALDNPDLIVTCIVGDGEAETGPTATAWHSIKFLDPATSGAILPILHLNGFKISSPTIFATMSDAELINLFSGYGYAPSIVDTDAVEDPDAVMAEAMDRAYEAIRAVQSEARSGHVARWRWPVLLLRSPKGWTGPVEIDGVPIEGTSRAHQVPAKDAGTNPAHLAVLETWLRSYRPEELFDADGCPELDILAACPTGMQRIGMNPHTRGWQLRRELDLPPLADFALPMSGPGQTMTSALERAGTYLAEVLRRSETERNFRIVCPDETTSNLLGAVFTVTDRAYAWPVEEAAAKDADLAPTGRVMEILSEHTCQGWLQGYLQTGRHGLFPCYEAFVTIVDSMANQYGKWPGSQWLFAPRTRLHQLAADQEGLDRPHLPAAGREQPRLDPRSLPALGRLHQSRHRHQTAAAAVAVDGRGDHPQRRRSLHLAVGRAGRSGAAGRRPCRGRQRADDRGARGGEDPARGAARACGSRHQCRRSACARQCRGASAPHGRCRVRAPLHRRPTGHLQFPRVPLSHPSAHLQAR